MHHVPTVTVQELPDPLPDGTSFLDVREPVEWEHGHIDGAAPHPDDGADPAARRAARGRMVVVCKVGAARRRSSPTSPSRATTSSTWTAG